MDKIFDQLKDKLIKNEAYVKVKDYSKEKHIVITYYEAGKLLSIAGKQYGKNIMQQYADKLIILVDKKYHVKTLYRMKQFYEKFSNDDFTSLGQKFAPTERNLTWSHYNM